MTDRRNLGPRAAAIQYLTWALEETEKAGHQKASYLVRVALEELRGTSPNKDEHAT